MRDTAQISQLLLAGIVDRSKMPKFLSPLFVTGVSLFHSRLSLFFYRILFSLRCLVFINSYFQVSFNLRLNFYVAKIT